MTELLKNQEAPTRQAEPIAPQHPEQPAGTVKRDLNFRDRFLLVGACRTFCRKDGKGSDHKLTTKLDRVTKLLLFSDVVDYFEQVDERLEDKIWEWQKSKNAWLAYRNYQNGAISLADFKLRAPSCVDVDAAPPERPSRMKPESSREDVRGPVTPFFLPSKLDAWVQDVLKAAAWDPAVAEFVTELLAKFGINSDD